MKDHITARGVRVHNLKGIDIDIPLGKFVVITGVSGSGKSSLAFDTLYAEGQRRYVETFSAYARQFLERMDKPDVDHIEGIPAAIAIEQKNPVKNRRSTVGTATEINDYLRLLFAKIGKIYCEKCGGLVKKDTVTDVVNAVNSFNPGTKMLVLFPSVSYKDTDGKCYNRDDQLSLLREKGIIRILADGEIIDIRNSTPNSVVMRKSDVIYGVLDRITLGRNIAERLTDAVETAFSMGMGQLGIAFEQIDKRNSKSIENAKKEIPQTSKASLWSIDLKFSNHNICNECDIEYCDPEPQHLSFNNPVGACPTCQGFGHIIETDLGLVVPDDSKSLREGAIAPWNTPKHSSLLEELIEGAPKYKIPLDVPFKKLTKSQLELVMVGTKEFYGIKQFFKKLERKKYKMHVRVFLSKYRGYEICPDCDGKRLNKLALNIKINSLNIAETCSLNIGKAFEFFRKLELTSHDKEVAESILNEISRRIGYMIEVGLDYLTLDRMTRTLSGGEAQRVNLTTSLGSSLVNTLYILDEPSIGLHQRDTDRLIKTIKRLRDLGNTVVVVEHDRTIIEEADELVDIGPEAGENGGTVVYHGTIDAISAENGSITAEYLSGEKSIEVTGERRKQTKRVITLNGASQNNLKDVDVVFPLDMLVCLTGVSGSGKSTLMQDTLYGALKKKIDNYSGFVGKFDSVSGHKFLNDVILIDQSPIGRTPRSNPVTYIKVFDEVRKLFAATREAKTRSKSPGHFSFNVSGGRCDNCEGCGQEKIEMQFLADIFVMCEHCQGKRFRKEILEIKYNGKNISEVLDMTVDEAVLFFCDSRKITKGLRTLQDTGLGYLRLGQSATTLSGGEAQRLKLATFISKGSTDRILFIFDEPTTGLHFHDISRLLSCFNNLVEAGHSLLVIEHNMDIIKSADYIIDLGPEGGDNGGRIVGCGTPEEIAVLENSFTGKHLRTCLDIF